MLKNIFYDGFNSKLIETTFFEGVLEMPILEAPQEIIIPIIIPNVRWGDERTYTKYHFDIVPAFSGIPKNSIVSIGTYGCSKTREDKYFLEAGLEAMLTELTPQDVIVYGSYNPKIFGKYECYTRFYHLPDWTTYVHMKKKVS